MIRTISFCDFRDAFIKFDRKDNFSYEAAKALYDYLEELDATYELDVIALCCDYAEDTIENVLENYGLESIDELHDHTVVIWSDNNNILYQVF